jgi:hypothetical protein
MTHDAIEAIDASLAFVRSASGFALWVSSAIRPLSPQPHRRDRTGAGPGAHNLMPHNHPLASGHFH